MVDQVLVKVLQSPQWCGLSPLWTFRCLSGVDPFVDLHPPGGASSRHRSQVVSQGLCGLQTIPAPTLGFLAVVLGVSDQNPLRVERTPTDSAAEGLGRTLEGGPLVLVLRCVLSDVFPQSSL